MAVKAVRAISSERMTGFDSTARKYPCTKMSEKTRTCRKMAAPRQLKPKLFIIRLILCVSFGSIVIPHL